MEITWIFWARLGYRLYYGTYYEGVPKWDPDIGNSPYYSRENVGLIQLFHACGNLQVGGVGRIVGEGTQPSSPHSGPGRLRGNCKRVKFGPELRPFACRKHVPRDQIAQCCCVLHLRQT